MRIISFSGRKQTGKSTLSEICSYYGYKNINFADELKFLICNFLNISLDFLNDNKETLNTFKLNSKQISFISKETNIPLDKIKENLENYEFSSYRNLLQYLGTNIIRTYNPNWHINKLKEKIEKNPTQKFVISDARFKNELQVLKDLGTDCWFILRPLMNNNISNHESEINIQWTDFPIEKVLINNYSSEDLVFKWKVYLNYGVNEFKVDSTNSLIEFYDNVKDNLFQKENDKLLI